MSEVVTQPPPAIPAQDSPAPTPPPEKVEAPAPEKTATPTLAGQPVVPEKYDFKLPDGALLVAKDLEEVSAFAKANNLTQEQAQSYLERQNAAVKGYHDRVESAWVAQEANWLKEIESDKEVGGVEFKKNIELAHRALSKFGGPEFLKELNDTRLGNHPGLVRTFVRIAKEIGEDTFVPAGNQSGGEKPIAEYFYGKTEQ